MTAALKAGAILLALLPPTAGWEQPKSCGAINTEWMAHTPGDQTQGQYVRRFPFSWRPHVRRCLKTLSDAQL